MSLTKNCADRIVSVVGDDFLCRSVLAGPITDKRHYDFDYFSPGRVFARWLGISGHLNNAYFSTLYTFKAITEDELKEQSLYRYSFGDSRSRKQRVRCAID